MTSCERGCSALACAVLVLLCSGLAAQSGAVKDTSPATPDDQKQQIATALKLTTEAAKQYVIKVGDANGPLAKQVPEPILRWSNPAAGEVHGHVFLWTLQDRPVLVGSLFKWFSPHTHSSHEFHSLWELPLDVAYEGKQLWKTREGGIKFMPLEDAPRPAATAAQRLLQMRGFAREFAATKRERNDSQQQLRLLPQPIHRYATGDDGIVDGGMFVFVQGTDPEVFVLLEARSDGDSVRWYFAAARMNSVGFQLRYKDREVWRAEIMPWRDISEHSKPYTTFMHKVAPSDEETCHVYRWIGNGCSYVSAAFMSAGGTSAGNRRGCGDSRSR